MRSDSAIVAEEGCQFPIDRAGNELKLCLRPASPEDEDFLKKVYAGTRMDELALTDWDEKTKGNFITMQFAAQSEYYRQVYPDAEYYVVIADGLHTGRLYLAKLKEEIRIIDIAVLPEFRNRGIGTSLLKAVLGTGSQCGKPVTIHVERMNPALRLYERLGFRSVEDKGVYLFLRWSPEGS